jgi:LysM repeat protein
VYTVQPGDTLFAIATRFGVSVDELVRANRLVNPDSLQVGQQITIPPA